MKTVSLLLVVILAIPPATGLSDDRPTADELLASFEKSVEKLARVKIEWNQKGRRGAPFDQETTVFRDGPRWKAERLLVRTDDNGPGRKTREQTLIGDEIVMLSLTYDPLDDKPRLFGLTAACERVAVRTWTVGRLGCDVLFGRMIGDLGAPLWTVMREAGSLELLPGTEKIDGFETYLLKSRGKFGEHKVWLDPASGALPRRIEVHKLPGDLLNDEQLGTGVAPPPVAEPQTKTGRRSPSLNGAPLSEHWTRIDKIQIENQKDVFFIAAYESEIKITLAGAKPVPDDGAKQPSGIKGEYKFRVDVDPLEFPEDAFRFAIVIPDGTPVKVIDSYPLRYQGPVKTEHEWVAGKIRARVSK